MKSHDTIQATNATALAIAKATETINQAKLQNVHQDLRISNLEKANKRHEQKTNEIFKNLKKTRIFKKTTKEADNQSHRPLQQNRL